MSCWRTNGQHTCCAMCCVLASLQSKLWQSKMEYFYFECRNITLWPTVPFLEDLKVLANESTPNIKEKGYNSFFQLFQHYFCLVKWLVLFKKFSIISADFELTIWFSRLSHKYYQSLSLDYCCLVYIIWISIKFWFECTEYGLTIWFSRLSYVSEFKHRSIW